MVNRSPHRCVRIDRADDVRVLDQVGGNWLGVSVGSSTCGELEGEVWEAFTLQPRPDGTFVGEVTQTMHFTPPPTPARQPSMAPGSQSTAGTRGGDGRAPKPLATTGTPFTIIRQHARGGLGRAVLKEGYGPRVVVFGSRQHNF